jgi:hypothetical protein
MNLDTTPTLTEQQHRIIARLASGWSINLAAKSEGIHRNTVGNWRRTNPTFARELEFAASEQRRCWQDEAVQRAPLAIQTIGECITDPKTSPSVRLRAATFIISMAADPEPKARKIGRELAKTSEPVQAAEISKTAQNAQPPLGAQDAAESSIARRRNFDRKGGADFSLPPDAAPPADKRP